MYLWWRFYQESGGDFVYTYCIVNKCTWHPHHSGYRNETKIFELSIARRLRWYIVFVDLKLPSLIAETNNPCKYFPVACVILQIIFKFSFFQYACLCKQCGFSLRGSQYDSSKLRIWKSYMIPFHRAGHKWSLLNNTFILFFVFSFGHQPTRY